MSSDVPRPDIQFEKKQAKILLKNFRLGDADAVHRMRLHLPRLQTDSHASLADAQFVIAREGGFASWARLKADMESKQPLTKQAENFLLAVAGNRWSVARRLLSQHPRIATCDIHTACAAANAAAVARFLEADPGCTDRRRWECWSPLHFVCASRLHADGPRLATDSVRCAQLLLDHGADPNTFMLSDNEDPNSRLPVLYYACVSNNVAIVDLLLNRGAEVNDGESLYHAAELNHRECLELLHAHGAELSERHPHWNNTPLCFLADAGAGIAGIEWLLEHGADPNITSGDKHETPLHRAAAAGNAELIRLLLRHGADANLARADGRTAYALALRTGKAQVVEALQAAGALQSGVTVIDELLDACMSGDASRARALAGTMPDLPQAFSAEDKSILSHAAHLGLDQALGLMSAVGFDLSWESEHGGTPLHWAAWHGKPATVSTLLQLGAPIDVRDSTYGSSPIAWAAHGSTHCRSSDRDYCAVVDLLIDAGASYPPSINRWNEPLQSMASRKVRARLIERGFAPKDEEEATWSAGAPTS